MDTIKQFGFVAGLLIAGLVLYSFIGLVIYKSFKQQYQTAIEKPAESRLMPFEGETGLVGGYTTLDEVLKALIQCESGGWQYAINHNDNGTPSFGILQFKLKTFAYYGDKYNLRNDDIFSKEQQLAIAKKMMTESNWERHWKTCYKQINR